MSVVSVPASAGSVSSTARLGYADRGVLPLRVRVKTPKTVIRPTVGLRVGKQDTMRSILASALTFQDRFAKTEEEIIDILSQPVDIVVANAQSENTDAAVRVDMDTSVEEALMYEDMDRVLFEITPSVSTHSFFSAHPHCFLVRLLRSSSLRRHQQGMHS